LELLAREPLLQLDNAGLQFCNLFVLSGQGGAQARDLLVLGPR
jgi:hypothetical protein